MSSSSLVIFLPLLGAILGAIVGALGGAWANGWYRDREAKKERDQELKGLTLLLFTEIGHNDALLQMHEKYPAVNDRFSLTNLQTDIWIGSRIRMAQLLTNEHTAVIVAYYGKIQDILRTVNDNTLHNEIKNKFVADDAKKAQKYGKAAMMHGGKYMFVDYPEFTDVAHDKFVEEARKLIGQ